MSDLKICGYCKKEIAKDAIKCPYCREWLNKTSLSFKNPFFLCGVIILVSLGGSTMIRNHYFKKYFQSEIFKKPISYSKTSKLKINNLKLHRNEKGIYLIGTIENGEKFEWDTVELLAVFKDEKDKVVYLSDKAIFDLRPGEKRPFQIDSGCSDIPLSSIKFATHEVEIERAESRLK